MTSVSKSPNHDLAASIGKNTVFGVVSRVTQLGTRLITIPIVIAHLGLDGYGIWSIVMTTAAYMRFGSIGIKSAFQKYVAEAVAKDEYEVTNGLLSTGCAFMLILSAVGLLPVAMFSQRLAKFSGVPSPFLASSSKAILVLALIMMVSNIGAVYEAIVMGGHRIDLARKFTTFFCVAEAVAIVCLLHYGYGLFAMACVMAASEIGFITCCYFASKKVVPRIRVAASLVTSRAIRELTRFAGSYQLRSVLEVLYLAIIPITILRSFGAQSAGVYALSSRLLSTATTATDAFLLPILTGGTAVYTSGSVVEMRALIVKSFKVTLSLGLLPLAFMSVFGTTLIYAWTGQADPSMRAALWLVCIAGLWQAFSILGIVLYRASGSVLLDNVQQFLRIVILLGVAMFSRELHFVGVLAGLAFAELIGMLFMLYALSKTFEAFTPALLAPDAMRITVATATILGIGCLTLFIPIPSVFGTRASAAARVVAAFVACVLATWPMLWVTKSFSPYEAKTLIRACLPRRMQSYLATAAT
jgi:O-antigen/teichoic acid export membrane protein